MPRLPDLSIENANILPGRWRNFRGEKGLYNEQGKRQFSIVIDPAEADSLLAAGWNIKTAKPRDEEDEPIRYLTIEVRFSPIEPKVVLINGKGKTRLTEQTISVLDFARFSNVDLVINPYQWQTATGSGVKAYMKVGYFTIEEDAFAAKYYDVDDLNEPIDTSEFE